MSLTKSEMTKTTTITLQNGQVLNDISNSVKTLEALPKVEVYTGLVPNEYVGYHPMEYCSRAGRPKKDLCEAFNWAYDAKFDPEALNSNELSINIRPDSIPGYKETLFKHHTKMLAFSHKMTRIFALALHLDESAFDAYIKRLEAGMRILHYPQQEASAEDQNKIGAHTLISNVSPPSRKTTVAASKSFLNLEIG
ncbi:hypothetical protein BGZ60DRAFT_526588 [Tricladium varicosporioides]|nr:hypothetical protein BGZ60DRAFT_526588 [Hymenoscyphus varicosporioides]